MGCGKIIFKQNAEMLPLRNQETWVRVSDLNVIFSLTLWHLPPHHPLPSPHHPRTVSIHLLQIKTELDLCSKRFFSNQQNSLDTPLVLV